MRRKLSVSAIGLALASLSGEASADQAGLRLELETGMPLVGAGLTTEVAGVRHAGEYPVWELTPFVGGRFGSDRPSYSVGLMAPVFWEIDCHDSYCERFGFYNLGVRAGIRPGSSTTWTLGLTAGASMLIIPGIQHELSDGGLLPYLYATAPVAPSSVGVGIGLHAGLGLRVGR